MSDDFWFPHAVQVRDARSGGMGDSYGPTRTLQAEVRDEQKVITGADASEVISSTQVTVPLASSVSVGAQMTVWAGTTAERTSTVLAVRRDENDPWLPSHLILSLE